MQHAMNRFRIVRPLALGLLAMTVAGCSPVRWETNYEAGLKRAVEQRRRTLLQFYSPVNMDCQEMDRAVFADEKVQELMRKFVAVRVDSLLDRELAKQFNVQAVPAFFIIRPDGKVAGVQSGKLDVEKFRFFLIKHSYN